MPEHQERSNDQAAYPKQRQTTSNACGIRSNFTFAFKKNNCLKHSCRPYRYFLLDGGSCIVLRPSPSLMAYLKQHQRNIMQPSVMMKKKIFPYKKGGGS